MANNTTLTRVSGSPRLGYEIWQVFLGDGSTKVTATITGAAINIAGASSVIAKARVGTYDDGSYTLTLEGNNDHSVVANWATIGGTPTALTAAGEATTGVSEASSISTGTIGRGVNLPLYCRAVLTAATITNGSPIQYIYVKVVHAGVTGGA